MAEHGSGNEPRLLFASYHCFLDPSSGAAIATRDLLELLHTQGWSSRVLCGPQLDFERNESLAQLLSDQNVPFEEKASAGTPIPFSLLHFRQNDIPGTIYVPSHSRRGHPRPEEGRPFLALFERLLDQYQPNVLLTYGGHWVGYELMKLAKSRGIAVVFALHNFSYNDARPFRPVDAVLVPSQFCADHYRRALGLKCTAIPSPLNWSRIR